MLDESASRGSGTAILWYAQPGQYLAYSCCSDAPSEARIVNAGMSTYSVFALPPLSLAISEARYFPIRVFCCGVPVL